MNGRPELLQQRRVGIVGTEVFVARFIAVGAPVAFDFSGIHVDDGNSLVAIPVGNIGLVRLVIDEDLSRSAEVLHIVTTGTFSRTSKLGDKLTTLRKFQNLGVR